MQAFNGKKWEKFNSEKVASLAYARIQGKAALVNHFQNSSLMNEDKRCRPILFYSDGSEACDEVIDTRNFFSFWCLPLNLSDDERRLIFLWIANSLENLILRLSYVGHPGR